MICQRCKSTRMATLGAKCSDRCDSAVHGHWHCDSDYVPGDLGVGAGDYVELDWCLDCGQIRGEWPLPKSIMEDMSESPSSNAFWLDEDFNEHTEPKENDE